MSDRRVEITDAWDIIADAYQSRYEIPDDIFHYGPMCPDESEIKLLGDLSGKSVLDLGCGGGQNTIWLASQNAKEVIGLDPSANQISHAKDRTKDIGSSAKFLVGQSDVCRNWPARFDLIVSVYAMMYPENLLETLEDLYFALKLGGRLVVSVDHPWRVAGSWSGDTFTVGNYFDEGWDTWDYDFPEQEIKTRLHRQKRTIETWVCTLLEAGFSLDGLREPPPPSQDDTFGKRSKHGVGSPKNVYARHRVERLPATLLIWGHKP